jgi:hypothetical protein
MQIPLVLKPMSLLAGDWVAIDWLQSQSHVTTDGKSRCQAPSEDQDQIVVPASCGFVDAERPLWREAGSAVYNCCWPSPEQSFSGLSPTWLVTTFYCLRFVFFFFLSLYFLSLLLLSLFPIWACRLPFPLSSLLPVSTFQTYIFHDGLNRWRRHDFFRAEI